MGSVGVRTKVTEAVYNFLDTGKGPRLSDCIFVPAGNQEWRFHGIKMWRIGYASQLLLSVGGLESGKFSELKLDSDGGLEKMASQTLPERKHFFVKLDRQEAACYPVRSGWPRMHSEAKALAEYLSKNSVRSLLILSSPLHLRRTSLTFRRALRKCKMRLTFVAVPERMPAHSKIWSEFRSYLFYVLCRL